MGILITGGGGYLGYWVAQQVLAQGQQVRIFDRFCFGEDARKALEAQGTLDCVTGDIRRLQDTENLFEGIDTVIHLASIANDPSCNLDADMAHDVNVESTLEWARRAAEAGAKRFVFASTCAVYGQGVFDFLDEASPANPVSLFGQTKLEAESSLLAMANDHFEPVVARMATLFGWSERMRFDLAINQMVATAQTRGRIEVRGGGQQWRPFLHVKDAAAVLLKLAGAPTDTVSGQIYNVGYDEGNRQIETLAQQVAERLGNVDLDIARDDPDQRDFRVQFHKLKETFDFTPGVTVEEGIDEVLQGLKDAPDLDPFAEEHFNVHRMRTLRNTPVDEGGEPIAARFIPLAKPSLGEEEEQALLDVLRTGWITSGPKVPAFEQAFADYVGAPAAVGVSSCTAALHLSLVDMGVKPGDEVITSPITWASTGNTLLNMGAKVVLADVDPHTLNMTPESLKASITPKTKAIMPVHLAGHPCDMEAIAAIAKEHELSIVEDAAHALGTSYNGKAVGAVSSYTCFSFYAIKNITTIEGGMVTVDDPEKADRIRFLATNGLSQTAWERYGRSSVSTPMEVVQPGFKYIMGNVSAAMGLEQLKKFPDFKASRKRIANMYRHVLSDVDEIELPPIPETGDHAWHLFVIQFKLDKLNKDRDELAHALRMENVGSGVHFYGLHLHQYYREVLGMTPETCPNATEVSKRILSLPLHPEMTDKNVNEVVAALKKVIHHARK